MNKQTLSEQETALFAQAMQDVTRINKEPKVLLKKDKADVGQDYRRQSAEHSAADKETSLSLVLRKQLTQDDWLSFKRDGIQQGVYKNLRLGKYPLETILNLHKQSPSQARDALQQFYADCEQHNLRSLLISFGTSRQGCLIKSYLAQWLPALQQTQCFHTAMKHHGGRGAVYVLLRKSEYKRQQNRERHAARLGKGL